MGCTHTHTHAHIHAHTHNTSFLCHPLLVLRHACIPRVYMQPICTCIRTHPYIMKMYTSLSIQSVGKHVHSYTHTALHTHIYMQAMAAFFHLYPSLAPLKHPLFPLSRGCVPFLSRIVKVIFFPSGFCL